MSAETMQMYFRLILEKSIRQSEYRSCLLILIINPIILIWAAIFAFDGVALLQFIATFFLTPFGVFALQFSRRKRVASTNPNWKFEFFLALLFSWEAIFFSYRQAWAEFQMFSFLYSIFILISFNWSDAFIKFLKLNSDK